MLKTLSAAVLALVAALLLFAATRPGTFRVERSVSIDAAPERVYPLIADFHRWGEWSPYEKLDPAMQRSFGEVASGRGAVYEWAGDQKVGKGRMEITDATAPSHVAIALDFSEPFEAHNVAEFTLRGAGDATEVTWAMHGPTSYMAKLMGLFLDMDQLVGRDFERGLADLKAAAER